MKTSDTSGSVRTPVFGPITLLSPSKVEAKAFRSVLGTFLTGVTVVTAFDGDGRPRGLTANSFTSVSLDPPLILVCISKAAGSCAILAAADRFCVNILGDGRQMWLPRFLPAPRTSLRPLRSNRLTMVRQ